MPQLIQRSELKTYYYTPVHCPFCGVRVMGADPSDETRITACPHTLFIAHDTAFEYRSARLDDNLHLGGLSEAEVEAKWRADARGIDGLSIFILDMNDARAAGGLTIRPIRTMMNHSTTEVFFDDVEVPAENLIGEEGKGFRYVLSGMNAERILIGAECVGDAKWFIERSRRYANERHLFGRAIGQNQGVQFPIAKAYAQMRAAELMVSHAAELFEAGEQCGEQANMAKMLAADASWAAAEAAVQTHGGFGFAEEYDVERKFRETRLYQVAPISTNMILSYLSEHVLGLPRSY